MKKIISLNRRYQETEIIYLPRRDQLSRKERTKQFPDTEGIGCL
jgi:hypothetical protein